MAVYGYGERKKAPDFQDGSLASFLF